MEADAGTILKVAGDAGGCDDNGNLSEDGRIGIKRDTGSGAGDYDESGTSGSDGLDLDLSGRNACGDGSDGDGGEDGRMGQEADSGVVSEVEERADGAGDAAAPAAVTVTKRRRNRHKSLRHFMRLFNGRE